MDYSYRPFAAVTNDRFSRATSFLASNSIPTSPPLLTQYARFTVARSASAADNVTMCSILTSLRTCHDRFTITNPLHLPLPAKPRPRWLPSPQVFSGLEHATANYECPQICVLGSRRQQGSSMGIPERNAAFPKVLSLDFIKYALHPAEHIHIKRRPSLCGEASDCRPPGQRQRPKTLIYNVRS